MKLFLDDYRNPEFLVHRGFINKINPDDWVTVRSSDAAKGFVNLYGTPLFIAFDHDLEDTHYDGKENHERTGLTFAKWFTEWVDKNLIELPEEFDWCVHSMNPVGAQRIKDHMASWFRGYLLRQEIKKSLLNVDDDYDLTDTKGLAGDLYNYADLEDYTYQEILRALENE